MARTKAEVRDYLERAIGQSIDANCGEYRGQCVSLIKGLMNFLGVPNPYAARGNAKDCGDTLLRQGIATNGSGWLNVVVNRDMGLIDGVRYGHIWVDLANEANYEQNGRQALRTTKNTRPITQGQQIINLDKYIIQENPVAIIQNADNWWWRLNKLHLQVLGRPWGNRGELAWWAGKDTLTFIEQISDSKEADNALNWQSVGEIAVRDNWQQQIYDLQAALKGRPTPEQLADAQAKLADISSKFDEAKVNADAKIAENKKLAEQIAEYEKNEAEDKQTADTWLRRLGKFLAKYWVEK